MESVADGGVHQAIERRLREPAGSAAREDADRAAQHGTRQLLGSGLEVGQVHEDRLTVLIPGPATQPRQQVAFADASFAPQQGADAQVLLVGLAGQVQQLRVRRVVDRLGVGLGERGLAHPVHVEGIGVADVLVKPIQAGGGGRHR